MEASRAKSGSNLPGILVIGKTTAKMALASSFTRMATSMKACGEATVVMDRAHTGEMKLGNCAENTQAIGSRTRNMGEELSSIKMETDTMGTG